MSTIRPLVNNSINTTSSYSLHMTFAFEFLHPFTHSHRSSMKLTLFLEASFLEGKIPLEASPGQFLVTCASCAGSQGKEKPLVEAKPWVWCHQCKQKHYIVFECSCTKRYCPRCTLKHYGEDVWHFSPFTLSLLRLFPSPLLPSHPFALYPSLFPRSTSSSSLHSFASSFLS